MTTKDLDTDIGFPFAQADAGDVGGAADADRSLLFCDALSRAALQQIDRVARSEISILISGETGTGKEIIARHIHARSGRKGPFVAVNCGAFSEQLVEAELFGHEAGAFTGANQARAGWFEAAEGGTLLLDEVGDLPPSIQVKLLRVLQERQVVRLGSRRPIKVDVRVLAATNVDLRNAVAAKQFREDLFYRLSVAPIRLASLRERPNDVMPLVRHFTELYGRKLGLERTVVSADAERVLLGYHWPGNVRELENVVHLALILSQSGVIDVGDLRLPGTSSHVVGDSGGADPLYDLSTSIRRLLVSERESLYTWVERLLLTETFEHCERNQVRAARRLGISRNVLRAQLKRFGLLKTSVRQRIPAHEDART